ncbi:methyltransferase domain-containing protein [Pseudosulfitobacter sp. SM2401]|uniref:class I SAM-dependent methyltransferase n=1 Tax=Pseudosulfitobacter sp. SM2401 TaxID=3350098 RepID=UPI0036F2AF9A
MLDTPTYRSCPGCETTSSTPWVQYSQDDWQVVACVSCDLTYLRNPPGHDALKEDFAWEKTYTAKTAKSKGSTVFSPFVRKLRGALNMYRDKTQEFRHWFNDGHVLDIGCGWGQRILAPMTPYGIELSTELHKISDTAMRERNGYCLHGAGAEAIWEFGEAQFDGIVMFSYLEHETHVMDVLKGAHRALKPDGAVFIRVPNFGSLNRWVIGAKWCGFRYPDHVNYFTLATLTAIAKRAGFETILVNTFTRHVDDNISVLLRKSVAP